MSEITLGHAPSCILSMRKQTKEGHGEFTTDTKLSLRSVVFKNLFLPLVNNHFLFGAINASCLRSIWAISPVPPGELQDTLSHQTSCQHETGDTSPQSMPGHQIMSPNFFSPRCSDVSFWIRVRDSHFLLLCSGTRAVEISDHFGAWCGFTQYFVPVIRLPWSLSSTL